MTQEQKRIKIAEACGLYASHSSEYGLVDQRGVALPDYFSDLNACYEMEKVLPEYGVYFSKLERICQDSGALRWASPGIWSVHSTASQRAEAFGLTLGLWKEGE